jgi:hydroxymethylbilane synthase
MTTALRLGTRRSALATAQAQQVADALTARTGRPVELVPVTTYGDTSREALSQIGGTGVFVSALRESLLAGEVDLAVHSLKDLPTADPAGIALAAVPPREDPRDVLVARDGLTLAELPAGARVGTGSPRRAAQLRALGLGLEVVGVRGNVDTRLRLVRDGAMDAVVLARAGLARLGRLDEVTEVLDPLQMLPAPGQGALAIECRSPEDTHTQAVHSLLGSLDDVVTRRVVAAERTLLATLEAGCSAPVGAYGEAADPEPGELVPELYLRAVVAAVDGSASVRLSATGPLDEAARIGRDLATELLAEGAADLMWERVR